MRARLCSGSDYEDNRSNISSGDKYEDASSPLYGGSNFSAREKTLRLNLASKLCDATDDGFDSISDNDELYHQKAAVILRQAIPSVFCYLISML